MDDGSKVNWLVLRMGPEISSLRKNKWACGCIELVEMLPGTGIVKNRTVVMCCKHHGEYAQEEANAIVVRTG
jgi:hypothetical protein